MKVTAAKSSGFCFGVKNAVTAAQDAVRTSEGYDEIAAQTADEPEEPSDKAPDITEGEQNE